MRFLTGLQTHDSGVNSAPVGLIEQQAVYKPQMTQAVLNSAIFFLAGQGLDKTDLAEQKLNAKKRSLLFKPTVFQTNISLSGFTFRNLLLMSFYSTLNSYNNKNIKLRSAKDNERYSKLWEKIEMKSRLFQVQWQH